MAPRDDTPSYPSVRTVTPREHAAMVQDIFAAIPDRYDRLNRVLSLGQDLAWRRKAVARLNLPEAGRLLDLATGTGDLAMEAARRHPRLRIVGLDLTAAMLDLGRRKIVARCLSDRITLLQGDAMHLPFPDNTFDGVAVAFGIRNMPDRRGALLEMVRVLQPGGRLVVLEMHRPPSPLLGFGFRIYLRTVLPLAARLLARRPGAYGYLADSIEHFLTPAAFSDLMTWAGLNDVTAQPLTGGAVWCHCGAKEG